ncbi:MAG: 2-C-methyl-D-erythritol 2,4-cyclodiphosphate synthase [Chloroflexi bacterium]|nr:2-C-methyl-D-erythritol 2,4-cyclodiphosphate synthase [Chloroflexota bacterium]
MEYLQPEQAAEVATGATAVPGPAAASYLANSPGSEKVVAVIVAAGRSTRMAGLDKQFALAGGRPLLAYTAAVFEKSPLISEYVIVLSAENLARGRELAQAEGWTKLRGFIEGGARRQDSVWHGLRAFEEDPEAPGWVMIHDGARPFVTEQILSDGLEAARPTGACVAAVPVKDTIKRVDRDSLLVEETPPRELLWAIQTPQVFRFDLICQAHRQGQASGADVTDDAMMAELAGHPVKVFRAAYTNIKVTTPDDLDQARLILAGETALAHAGTGPLPIAESTTREPEAMPGPANSHLAPLPALRIGQGFDVHRLVPGRPLILGGVTIPFDLGLDGHSDADVLTHAIINALLGAAGMGDIGRHYPPSDPTIKGISSLQMLTELYTKIQTEGWQLVNLDATVVAQQPKLAPHIAEIRRTLAGVLGVEESRVNVKATTTEKLGFAGRLEGLEGQAVALLTRV